MNKKYFEVAQKLERLEKDYYLEKAHWEKVEHENQLLKEKIAELEARLNG